MDKKELDVIRDLMDKLSEEMEYGEDDFMERLGKKKPEVQVVKVEGKIPMDEESMEEPEMDEDMDEDVEMMEEESGDPEMELKKRLMQLRS